MLIAGDYAVKSLDVTLLYRVPEKVSEKQSYWLLVIT